MVVFTCNHCGDSLQKPKVAKHYQFQCRNHAFLTCVDCFKDFNGDEYVAHTKCITENERYGGKDYVQKQSANKGEKKQQAWITIVQNVLTNSTNLTVPERNLLNSISKHENIPRKKAKFFNFIKSLSNNRANMTIVENVWVKMESAFKEATIDNTDTAQKNLPAKKTENDSDTCTTNDNREGINNTNGTQETEGNEKKKKTKKRSLETNENDNGKPEQKKRLEAEVLNIVPEENTSENVNSKFSWKNVIVETVTSKGEISLKRLRKKVIAKYLKHFHDQTTENAISKFEKKLGKVSNILIENDKVRLA